MNKVKAAPLVSLLVLPFLLLSCAGSPLKEGATREVTAEMLLADLKAAPPDLPGRARWLKSALEGAGLVCEEQPIEGLEGRSNIVGTLKGATDKVIVVGAHLDYEIPASDILDDWTGIVLLPRLARSLAGSPTRCTWLFIGFDGEEEGCVGSTRFVSRIPPGKKEDYLAMVNLDCMAMTELKICSNFSSDALEEIALKSAEKAKASLERRPIWGVESDAGTFLRAGIPAISLDGVDLSRVLEVLQDRFGPIRPELLVEELRLLRQLLSDLDRLEERPAAKDGDVLGKDKERKAP